jgi:TolB-like protein/Flp pilus assembly protein TadD
MNPKNFFGELKRRNVIRATILYLGGVWALAQGISQLGPSLGAPDWATRWFLVAAGIGFPFWIAFAWFYEFTPEGLKRESEIDPAESITHRTGRKLDFAIIAVLAVAVVLLLTDRFVLRHGINETIVAPIPEKSIAVLPFVNISEDKANDYFSDGISEELLNLLAKIPQLKVTARVSSFSFKGKEVDIPEIARRLGVAHVLEGSVRKAGDQVRITAQLIHAADGFHMWSETYDRKLDDIFKIQDEVAGKVVKELKVTMLEPQPKVRTTDPKAYALYLQARQLGWQRTAEAYEKSDALLHQVLEIDPRYAPAWEKLAMNLVDKVIIGVLSSQDGLARAREAAEKALAIDPDYAPAHAQLGRIAMLENDNAGAAKHFERALALDPTDLNVLHNASIFLSNDVGRLDEALALGEAIVRRDPVNTTPLYDLGVNQRCAGRYDEAIASLRRALSLNPGIGQAHSQSGLTLLLKGDAAGALAEIEQETTELWRMVGLPMAYHALGRKADSDTALAALIAKYEKDSSYNIAYVYAFRGEADQAFAWLDKALEYHDSGLSEIAAENLFDKIHSDPRWLPFLRKIGKAPDQLAKIKFNVTLPPQ